ncbi:hypothetical protein EII31_01070 [Leucobacter sp. OH2974_COT-288]|uniref:Putative membrane protein YeiH n=1 Tax=Canibacter oris TaxID=1365628 RepID=A0A840DBF7_9MICO|nr:putative membrane protein YeiH [Canibacter oris]RRD36209.1 hypothetical protein EII31_01070 [Leucobacter sp. OH2974_COT-288]
MTETFAIPLALDLAAVALGSIQGAMYAAGFRRLDLLGVAVIAIVVGIGGSFIRDVLLNITPATLTTNIYLLTCLIAGTVGMLLQKLFVRADPVINILDALTLGAFTALGTTKALSFGLPELPAMLIGVTAAVGGGMIRDVLLNMPIAVMHVGSLYAVAAIVGSGITVTLIHFGVDVTITGLVCVVLTAVLRLLAMRFGWSLPEQRAFDRKRRRKQREVEETVAAIRTHTIALDQLPLIDPEGPNPTPSAS